MQLACLVGLVFMLIIKKVGLVGANYKCHICCENGRKRAARERSSEAFSLDREHGFKKGLGYRARPRSNLKSKSGER